MKNLTKSQKRRLREKLNLSIDALDNLFDIYEALDMQKEAQEIQDIMMQFESDDLKIEILQKRDNLTEAQNKLYEKIKNKEQFNIPLEIFEIHREDYDALEACELILTEEQIQDQITIFLQPQ